MIPNSPRRVQWLLDAAILLLALCVDVPGLWSDPWGDELWTLQTTSVSWSEMLEMNATDPTPLFYWAAMWLWCRPFGSSVAMIRLPSVLAHLVSILLILRIGRRFHSPTVSVCAGLAVAVSPAMTWFATNARPYSLMIAAVTGSVYCYRERRWVGFTMFTLLIGNVAKLGLVPVLFMYLWELAGARTFRTPMTTCGVVAFIGCIPVWIQSLSPPSYTPVFAIGDAGDLLVSAKWILGLDSLPPILVVLLVFVVAILVLLTSRGHRLELYLCVTGVLTFVVVSHAVHPLYHVKFIIWTLPLTMLCGFSSLMELGLRPAAYAWLAVILVSGLERVGTPKSNAGETALAFAKEFGVSDRVYFTSRANVGIMAWYLHRVPRSGKGPPSTWLVDVAPNGAPGTPVPGYLVRRFPGVATTPSPTWDAQFVRVFDPASSPPELLQTSPSSLLPNGTRDQDASPYR